MKELQTKNWLIKHPILSTTIMLTILLLVVIRYPWYYSGGRIVGKVVDKNTGEPVVGAVAVLEFSVFRYKLHGTREKVLYIAESVTDKYGRYIFEEWGPVLRPFGYRPQSNKEPAVFVFKQGYKKSVAYNVDKGDRKFKIDFVANKDPVVLEAYKNLEEELEMLKEHSSLMAWGVGYGVKCAWEKVPHFKMENDRRMRLYKRSLPKDYHMYLQSTIDEWTYWKEEGCLDPKIIFKEYLESLSKGEFE